MKIKKIHLVVCLVDFGLCLLCICNFSNLFAQYAGKEAGLFLKFNPDPKTAAVGDTSLSCQSTNNPAGLANIYRPKLMLSHTQWVEDIRHSYMQFSTPFTFGNLGFGLTYADYGKITGVDADQNDYSIPSSYDAVFTISYAKAISKSIPIYKEWGSVGAKLKFIKSSLANYSAEAVAIDIGTILNLGQLMNFDGADNLKMSLVYKNLGSKLKFVTKEFPLPSSFDFSLGINFLSIKNLSIVTDLSFPKYSNPVYSCGLSVDPIYFLSLRAGYKYSENSVARGVTAGFGLNLDSFELNYAVKQCKEFSTLSDLGLTHQISLELAVGGDFGVTGNSYKYYLKQHLNEVYELYCKREYELAKQRVENIISLFPDDGTAKQLLQKIDAAIKTTTAKKEKKTKHLLKKAKILSNRNDYILAKRNYELVLQLEPNDTDAKQGLKNIQEELVKINQSQINQKHAKKLTKLWNTATGYYKKGEFVKAKREFNQILEIDPEHAETKKYLTEIDIQITQLNAYQINELYLQATELFKKGKYKEASKYFESVVIAAPHRFDAKEFLSRCEQEMRNLEDKQQQEELAKQQQEKKEEMDKTFNTALEMYEKSNYLPALTWFEKSKEVALKYQFTEYFEKSQNNIEAIRMALAEQHYKNGYGFYQRNEFESAYENYSKSLQYNPNNVTVISNINKLKEQLAQKYYEFGISYYTSGESAKAKKHFEKSLFYDPNKNEALRALERIK
ncbi:MAG: PorV/PorQ family protein [Elusimicrobiota bacterium]